jgi:acyl carrier protein|tara:strand:- start:531 stop:797 length:267 start_codon:yes stop_codon:yes gene_type:complete
MDNYRDEDVDRIVQFVRSTAILAPSQEIPLDRSLLETGILDSFGIVELITFIECEFDLAIPDEDVTKEKLESILKMAEYIYQRRLVHS